MTDPILNALVLYAGAGFFFHRAWKYRDFTRCLPAALLFIFALTTWPFSASAAIRLIALYVMALIFLPFLWSKGLLKKKRVIWVYSLLGFLGLVYIFVILLLFNR